MIPTVCKNYRLYETLFTFKDGGYLPGVRLPDLMLLVDTKDEQALEFGDSLKRSGLNIADYRDALSLWTECSKVSLEQ